MIRDITTVGTFIVERAGSCLSVLLFEQNKNMVQPVDIPNT
jgi:hypothetical protein